MLDRLPQTIAIDGPVASGKSSVGVRLSHRLGHVFLDTGNMYRAFTWWTLRNGIAPDDGRALAALTARTSLDVTAGDDGTQVSVDGHDATPHLRDPAVERAVSLVSAHPAVREAMVREQRRLADDRPVIMAGRDIGTVVFPNADLKVFLDASVECRARRRALEMPQGTSAAAVEEALRQRDRLDTERDASPLRRADDAIVIDTNDLTLDEVVERVVALARHTARRAKSDERAR